MNPSKTLLAAAAVLIGAAATPALAGSSASSASSDSVSASIGTLSGSIKNSSESSSKTGGTAAGDYRIVDVAVLVEQPGLIRLQLQAVAGSGAEGEFTLTLPQEVFARTGLGVGGIVAAADRPYGVEFAQGQPRQPFFLVLADDWYRELQTRAVTL